MKCASFIACLNTIIITMTTAADGRHHFISLDEVPILSFTVGGVDSIKLIATKNKP